jgi:hypothetical protein
MPAMKRNLGWASLVASLTLGFHLSVFSAQAAPLLVQVDNPPPAGLPLELTGELATALTSGETTPVSNLQFIVRSPRQGCVCQTVPGAEGTSHLYWQPQGPGSYAISLRAAAGAVAEPGHALAPMARVEQDTIRIDNGAFTAVHNPRNAGGLPALTVAGATTPLPLEYADRLYRADVGPFSIVNDPQPEVRLIANGPLLAIVEVSGGYYSSPAGHPQQHAAQPRACYRFTYFRNAPVVQVNVTVSQPDAFAWKELHVLELRAKAPSRTASTGKTATAPQVNRWVGGEPALEGDISQTTGTHHFNLWAALRFDNGVIGVLNPHATSDVNSQPRIYASGNLVYVMGPWVDFAGPRTEFIRYLYLGPASAWRPALDELAGQMDRQQLPRVTFPELEAQAASSRQALLAAPGQNAQQLVQLWQINRALADLHALRNTAAARKILARSPALQTVPVGKPLAAEKLALGPGRDALVTDQLLLALDAQGRLTGFYQALTDTELLARPCAMFRFVVHNQAGEEALLTAHEAEQVTTEFKAGALHLRFSGKVFGTTPAQVDLVLCPDESSVFWQAEARVAGSTAVCWRLDFPVLDGVGRQAGDDHADNVLVPDGWGRLLPRPSAAHYQGRYPGGAATMQVLGYTRGPTTLGVIAWDGRCFAKDFVALGSEATRTVALEVRHYPAEMGYTNSCRWPYEVETIALAGDWFTLAEHYRAWATRQTWCDGGRNSRRPDSPDWFRKLVWWHEDGARDGAALTNTLAHLRKTVPFPMAFHWYNWHTIPFDNFYPDYFPANAYVPAVRAQLRAWGVGVMPYINGHLWDTQAKSYAAENAQRAAMKKFDGSIYTEHYNQHDLSIACPTTAAWSDKMVQVTDRLFREVGVDAVYLDQIGAVQAQLCYDGTHGHPRGGGDYYVAGYVKLLQAVRANARRINPDAALTTEDTAEPYLRYLDGTLMCNRAWPDSIPFFPAVYHAHIAQFGLYIHEPEIKAGVTFRSKEAMLFQFGAQLGWNGTSWSEAPAHQEKFHWLAQLAAYRQAGLDWLAYGDMLHPPRVTMRDGSPLPHIAEQWIQSRQALATDQPAVTTSAWRAADGRVALFVINVSDEPLQLDCQVPAEAEGKKLREWNPPGQGNYGGDFTGRPLRLDLAPRSVRMLVAQ